MFTIFKEKNAKKLGNELRKLKGKPVILTGGGGTGIHFAFMDGVRVKNYKREDKRKAKVSHVEVKLKAFPGETLPSHSKVFSPHIGSWRITALKGHGSEKISKKFPKNWEKD